MDKLLTDLGLSVPSFVPTPRIEALRTLVSDRLKGVGMSLKCRGYSQLLATAGFAEKLAKMHWRMLRDQEVGGSNPLAPTNLLNEIIPGHNTRCRYHPKSRGNSPRKSLRTTAHT